MQRLQAYRLLSTRSRRAIVKRFDRHGRPYNYRPQDRLLTRIANQLNITTEQAQDELFKDREFLLNLNA